MLGVLGGGGCLIELSMGHIEEAIHDERGICALKIVLGLCPRHIQILNLVYQNWRYFVNRPVSSGRRYYSLVQIQLQQLLLFLLRQGTLKLISACFQILLRVDVVETDFVRWLRVGPKVATWVLATLFFPKSTSSLAIIRRFIE